MAEHDLSQIHQLLGRLQATAEALEKRIGEMRTEATTGRDTVEKKLDTMEMRANGVETELVGVKRDLEIMETSLKKVERVTDEVTRWKLQGMGALAVTGVAASALTALALKFGLQIKQAIFG